MAYNTLKVFLPDTVNFHGKNFKSLMGFFARHNISITKNDEINSWTALYGDYATKLEELAPYMQQLQGVTSDNLLWFTYKNNNIWNIARAELLSWFLPQVEFNSYVNERNDKRHLALMSSLNDDVVRHCYAAAMYFLDYWKEKLENMRVHSHALIFSGSQIYNRAFLEILKHSHTNPVVMEHFFTGNEYYFEERYTPIANSTDLRYSHYSSEQSVEYDRLRIKAVNKVLLSNNRNVKKTGDHLDIHFKTGKTVGLIGQVVNDYSIIETATNYLNSIAFYKEFINKAINNGMNVVFKTHPWEKHKNNVGTSFTKEMIESWAESELTEAQRDRLVITESVDIDCIFKQVDFIAGLCSQGMLEACFEGFKPIQFGNAFFSNRDFTSDYTSVDDFISDMNENQIKETLTIKEYSIFEGFLVEALERQLVSVHKSGILSLEQKMKVYPLISLVGGEIASPEKRHQGEREHLETNIIDIESVFVRKLKKFKRNPKVFLKDSKFTIFRAIFKVF